jgi:uncharacterized protein YbjT (DUF2867 family)
MTDQNKTILVMGATGKQGGSVLRHLTGKGFKLRAMTRKPDGDAARALAAQGVEVLTGDFDDARSLGRALEGAWGVFAVQNTWEAGVEREEQQGKAVATAAREHGVSHFVYTSVGSAHRKTGIPHFDNKARVEARVRELGFPSHVILRPVFFMENLPSPWFLHGDQLMSTLSPETRLQMIAVEDIGAFGALAFERASQLSGREIDIAGDSVTLPEAAAILSSAMHQPIRYQRIPIEGVRQNSEDMALMLEWFERVGYDADISALQRDYPVRLTTLRDWAATQVTAKTA